MNDSFANALSWILFLGLPLAFLAIAAWVWRPGTARAARQDARLPFEDEKPPPASSAGNMPSP